MNILAIARQAISIGASAGTTQVVMNVVKATTPHDIGKVGAVLTTIGGFVISSMVSEQVETYTHRKFDELKQLADDAKDAAVVIGETINEAQQEVND